MKQSARTIIMLALVFNLYGFAAWSSALAQDPKVELGRLLFFDASLSANGTQSCAACHAPETGFTGPDSLVNLGEAVYQGALPNRFGNRKPPTSAYAGDSPVLHFDDAEEEGWFGGMFSDGRATGAALGDPLAEQAQGPFLNPLEQALPNAQVLCVQVKNSDYAGLFEEVWGNGSLNCAKDVSGVYERIGRSIAAYERSAEVNPFTSKFDLFWDNATAAGKDVAKIKCGTGGGMGAAAWAVLRGVRVAARIPIAGRLSVVWDLPTRSSRASRSSTTPAGPTAPPAIRSSRVLLVDPSSPTSVMTISAPRRTRSIPSTPCPTAWNPDGAAWIDPGLGGFLKSAGYAPEIYEAEMGKHKVPTLRNVDLRPSEDFVKSYGHNGYFKSLDDIVFFYHWRAAMGTRRHGRWDGWWHGRNVPATGSGSEPHHAEHVSATAGRQHRGLSQDAV